MAEMTALQKVDSRDLWWVAYWGGMLDDELVDWMEKIEVAGMVEKMVLISVERME